MGISPLPALRAAGSGVSRALLRRHRCPPNPLVAPRQRSPQWAVQPRAIGRGRGAPRGGGGWGIGGRRWQSKAAEGGPGFIPKFYLVSEWHEDPSHNKMPLPSKVSEVMPDKQTCFILHGVFGSGKNWIPFVRTHLAPRLPGWQFVLLDLRGHGESEAGEEPHTLSSCAADIRRLADAIGRAPDVLIGHSLGGKIALEYLEIADASPRKIWVLDSWAEKLETTRDYQSREEEVHWGHLGGGSGPSFMRDLQPGASMLVLQHLEAIPTPIRNRTAVMESLTALGHCKQTATWMCSNLRPAPGGGLQWRFDLRVVGELIFDAAKVDSLKTMEKTDSEVGFVRAGKGMRWSEGALQRLERSLALNPKVNSHVLTDAAHWVHVDSPQELCDLMHGTFAGM